MTGSVSPPYVCPGSVTDVTAEAFNADVLEKTPPPPHRFSAPLANYSVNE